MITSSNADFDEDGFGSVVRDLERAYLMLAELGMQGGDSPTSTVINYNSELGGGNATMTPAVMGGTLLNTNTGSTIVNKYNVALNGNWLDASGVNPSKGNGGNARGANAIDWQIYRSANDRVTSGDFSSITGSNNKVQNYKTSVYGNDNVVTSSDNSLSLANYPFFNSKCINGSNNILTAITSIYSSINISGDYNTILRSLSTAISPYWIGSYGYTNNFQLKNNNGSYTGAKISVFGHNNYYEEKSSSISAIDMCVFGRTNTIYSAVSTLHGLGNYIENTGVPVGSIFGDSNNLLISPSVGSVDEETKYLITNNPGSVFVGNGNYYSTILRSAGSSIVLHAYSSNSAPVGNNAFNAISFRHATNTTSPYGFVNGFSFSHDRISSGYASTTKPRFIFSNSGISIDSNTDILDASDVSLKITNTGSTGVNLISPLYPYFRINGTKILTTQQAAIANVTYNATWTTVGPDLVSKFNDLLAKLRTHGIIAT